MFTLLPRHICHRSSSSPFTATSDAPPMMAPNFLLPSIIIVVNYGIPAPQADD